MESRSKDWLGRIWIFLVGCGLFLTGAFFCWWLGAAWQRAREMDRWLEVPAEVLSFEVREYRFNELSQMEYVPEVRYRYEVSGGAFVGDAIRRVPVRTARRDRAEAWGNEFPPGKRVRAYVDPVDPARAVLKKNSKAALYAIWFPALFVLAGMMMCINALRRQSPMTMTNASDSNLVNPRRGPLRGWRSAPPETGPGFPGEA